MSKYNKAYGFQKEVADKTGLSRKTVWTFFNNGKCSIATQIKISKAIKEVEKDLK